MKNSYKEKVKVSDVVIKIENLKKNYKQKDKTINVLLEINIEFSDGKFYAIRGCSGSGKSTLINILGLIDSDYDGIFSIYREDVRNYKSKDLSNLRMENIGFIFQGIFLDPMLKAYENTMVPMLINKKILKKDRKNLAIKLLREVGLGERIDHYPNQMSGGEQQRVAIARAMANDPHIILADEPTGNLDKKNEHEIFNNLKKLSKKGRCIIVVSHSDAIFEYADEVYQIEDGKLVGVKK